MMIRRIMMVMLITASSRSVCGAFAQGLPDVKITDVAIDPKPAGTDTPRIQLHTSRSYRVTVTIQKDRALPKGSSFIVRTECIRNGKAVTLGESRVGEGTGWSIYACYDVYPSQGGGGDCLLRTTVDADHELKESDETPVSNIWDRKATILP
jgi:hypothetical protein